MTDHSAMPDYSVSEMLGCYELSDEDAAILELSSQIDTPESLESLEPNLQRACRSLIKEANAEAEFNERFATQS